MSINWDQSDRTDPAYAGGKHDGACDEAAGKAFADREGVKVLCDDFAERLMALIAVRALEFYKGTKAEIETARQNTAEFLSCYFFNEIEGNILDLPDADEAWQRAYDDANENDMEEKE